MKSLIISLIFLSSPAFAATERVWTCECYQNTVVLGGVEIPQIEIPTKADAQREALRICRDNREPADRAMCVESIFED